MEGLSPQGNDLVSLPMLSEEGGDVGSKAFLDCRRIGFVTGRLVGDRVGQQDVGEDRLEVAVRFRRGRAVTGLVNARSDEPPPAPIKGWPAATSSLPRSRPNTQGGR